MPLPEPYLVARSGKAAALLGLAPDAFDNPGFVAALSGNRPLAGADPLAAVYSGHQFGVYVPRLGDGRSSPSTRNRRSADEKGLARNSSPSGGSTSPTKPSGVGCSNSDR